MSPVSLSPAGFLTIFNEPQGPSLIVSEFTGDPFASDAVAAVYGIGAYLGNISKATAGLQTLTTNITWPNEVTQLDSTSGMGLTNGLLVAGGFLVPPKQVGAVTALVLDAAGAVTQQAKISVDDGNALFDGYFYHRALLHDCDGDGINDVITARAVKPLIGNSAGELVWLKNPGGPAPLSPASLPWQESVLLNGSFAPDVLFQLANLRNDTDEQLVFASFFTGGGLGMVYCAGCAAGSGSGNTWSNAADLQLVILDASIGPSFDVAPLDMNGDGRIDLLVTNHVDNATDGGTPQSGVFVYEAPLAPTSLTNASAWVKHTLASGFAVREFGPGQAAPGAFKAFFPCAAGGDVKPSVVLSGDGDQRVYMLQAVSQTDPTNWQYTLTQVYDCAGTVGQPTVGDTDGDGCVEVFVPCYDVGIVQAFRFTA
jgi:hypothetical protein